MKLAFMNTGTSESVERERGGGGRGGGRKERERGQVEIKRPHIVAPKLLNHIDRRQPQHLVCSRELLANHCLPLRQNSSKGPRVCMKVLLASMLQYIDTPAYMHTCMWQPPHAIDDRLIST